MDPWDLDDLLDDLLQCDDLWYLDYPFNNLLNDLLYLHKFRHNSEDFQDISHTDYIHDLLADHPNHSLVYFEDYSGCYFDFLEFFK